MNRPLIFRALAALGAAGFFLFAASGPVAATPWTPTVWKDNGKLRHWVRDTNDNFVDDLIEARTDSTAVIVDLNGCVGDPASSPFIAYLKTLGDVTYVGKYLSLVVVTGIDRDEARQIGARPEVAMVELAQKGRWTWDVYQAAKVRASTTYAQTLESGFGWPATLNGSGANVAILDTGVGVAYDASFRHGYNALTDAIENPSAEPAGGDHAGHMAQLIYDPANGIARGAGLIDIKIGDGSGPDPAAYVRALEKVYEMHRAWQIHVVSISAAFSGAADGRESWNQLVDLVSGMGVLVVAGSGDNAADSPVLTPGAATRALAVATADIHNTVDRANDTATTVQGPRANDLDDDPLDELKPEVVFPMGGSVWLPSNSAATAATAGLAALAFGHNPQLRDFDNAAAANVKDLLIRSAEARDAADTAVAYPQPAATWDSHWGFGEIDAHQVFHNLSNGSQGGVADLTFLGFDGSAHPNPSDPWYYSHAVETESERGGRNIGSGVADRIYARVHNNGPGNAQRVRISFGFYPFTAGIPTFYDLGSQIVDIANGETREVSIAWTPPDLPPGEFHGCILVTIDYGYDTQFGNRSNVAQKNVRVHDTSSPAKFDFRVENTLPVKATIRLRVENQFADWNVKLSEDKFVLDVHDCARLIQAVVTPTASPPKQDDIVFFVTAQAAPFGTEDFVDIGGVALRARYGGGAGYYSPPWATVATVLILAVALLYLVFRIRRRA